MITIFAGNSLWQLVRASDSLSVLVLIILLVLSILSWTIFLFKLCLFYYKKRQFSVVITELKNARTIEELALVAQEHAKTLPGYFLSKNIIFLQSLVQSKNSGSINYHDWERLQFHMNNLIDTQVMHEES